MKTTVVLALAALTLAGCATSRVPSDDLMQTRHHFKKQLATKAQLDYLLYLPADYQSRGRQRWPLLLFLHGAGERGTNLALVAKHGPPKLVKQKRDFPFIIVSPQCPANEIWEADALLALLDQVMTKHAVNTKRVYLTGLSMGGYGTWSLGLKAPERFAAIAPICGGGDTIQVKLAGRTRGAALKRLGVWAFHGARDEVVPVNESERMIEELKRAGCKDVKLTVYPEAGHDSWTAAYEAPEFYTWLLEHHR